MKNLGVVIAAGGNSLRMGFDKLTFPLRGKPVILWSIAVFDRFEPVSEIVVCAPPDRVEELRRIVDSEGFLRTIRVISGGKTRSQSVKNGIFALENADFIAIHDGARPLLSDFDLQRVYDEAVRVGGAILCSEVSDSLHRVKGEMIEAAVARDGLVAAQTPQIFKSDIIKKAYALGNEASDDCALVLQSGGAVAAVKARDINVKLTTPADMELAKIYPAGREAAKMRVGQGYDAHRLADGRKLVLGGVEIAHEKGLLGHSDADVLCHAVADALLGAAALGDIGRHFPASDPQYEGISSLILLEKTAGLLKDAGFEVLNVDSTVAAQAPRLSPYIDKMRENIARAIGISPENVSVKATTEEGLGFTGRKEGISARAVCMVRKVGM